MLRAELKRIEKIRPWIDAISHEIFTAHVVPLKPHLKAVVMKTGVDPVYKDKVERIVRERYPRVRVIYVKD